MTRGRAIWPYRVTFRPYMDPSRNARRFSCWHSLVAPIYTTSRGGYKDLRALLDIRALPLLLNSTALQARGRWCRCCNVAGCSAPPTRAPPCGGIWGWSGRSNKALVGFQVGNGRVVCRFGECSTSHAGSCVPASSHMTYQGCFMGKCGPSMTCLSLPSGALHGVQPPGAHGPAHRDRGHRRRRGAHLGGRGHP